MSTQTRTPQPTPNTATAETTRPKPRGRTLAGGVLAGAIVAVLLTLIVFPGATEAITTGALLAGFAFGWALMGALTARRTRQPQWWAIVPAVAMGVTGIALILVTPGGQTLDALNWVWPPLMLVLTGWVYVRLRRSVPGKARRVLTPVLAVLVLASVGALIGNIAGARDRSTFTAAGKMYDVGGHRLHLDCRGTGSPTVVLSNSLGGTSADWARITAPVSATTRVCAYDRAGQGWSDEAASPRDGVESATDLHTLLAKAGEHGPYVLVGHSTGGTYAMTYAARYPDQVVGLVLLDSSSPEQFTRMPAFPSQYAMMRRTYGLLPTLSRLGIGHLIPGASLLPGAEATRVDAVTSAPKAYRNQRDEVSVIPQVFAQARALTTLGDRPLAVLTASETSTGTKGWDSAQDQLAALSSNSIRRSVLSSHPGLVGDARPAEASVRAITEVLISARSHTSLPPS